MKNNLTRMVALALTAVLTAMLMLGGAGAETLGGAVQYDPAQPVNNGEPISIEFWYWTGAENLFKSVVEQYTAIHPNVTVTLVENPWDDYWTKLPPRPSGQGWPRHLQRSQQPPREPHRLHGAL